MQTAAVHIGELPPTLPDLTLPDRIRCGAARGYAGRLSQKPHWGYQLGILACVRCHPVQYRREGMCPGGRPGLQNQWQAAQSRLRWVRLPRLPALLWSAPVRRAVHCIWRKPMDIPLFQDNTPLRFERIVLYSYPDLKRIWARVWLPAVQGQAPNVELTVFDGEGSENTSVYMMARSEQRVETTLHLRNPQPGATYRVVAELTEGISDKPTPLDRQEFDLILEFRDPEAGEPGFGIGVDWDSLNPGDRTA